jgi:hypothetical protein
LSSIHGKRAAEMKIDVQSFELQLLFTRLVRQTCRNRWRVHAEKDKCVWSNAALDRVSLKRGKILVRIRSRYREPQLGFPPIFLPKDRLSPKGFEIGDKSVDRHTKRKHKRSRAPGTSRRAPRTWGRNGRLTQRTSPRKPRRFDGTRKGKSTLRTMLFQPCSLLDFASSRTLTLLYTRAGKSQKKNREKLKIFEQKTKRRRFDRNHCESLPGPPTHRRRATEPKRRGPLKDQDRTRQHGDSLPIHATLPVRQCRYARRVCYK